MIDFYAPIIPYVGMAGITLYSTENEVNKIVSLDSAEKKILNDKWVRYDIDKDYNNNSSQGDAMNEILGCAKKAIGPYGYTY